MSKSKSASALISSPMSHGDFYRYDASANRFVAGEPPDTMSVRKHLDRLVLKTERFFVREVNAFPDDSDVAKIDIDASGKTMREAADSYEQRLAVALSAHFGENDHLELCWKTKPGVWVSAKAARKGISKRIVGATLLARKC